MISRLAAIVRADMLIRFRRLSTLVIFLLLSAMAYLWVPDPKSGRTIMAVNNARVLYNSAALGVASASLATLFVGLFGFYVISNALRRDVESRCGFVIASTTMRGREYLAGKLAGNVVFLTTFIGGFMIAAMMMLLVRGEAPLQPLVFAKQYLVLVPSSIVFVSVIAIVFESVPWLSGRFGDVVYFFLWAFAMSLSAISATQGVSAARYLDFSGFGFLIDWSQRVLHTSTMSIGSTTYDKAKTVVVTPGLTLTAANLVERIVSTVAPLPLLGIALVAFHRFDPARVRVSGAKGGRRWGAKLNMLAKPLVRPLVSLAMRGGANPSLLRAAFADALITYATLPAAFLALIGISIAALASRETLPIVIGVAGVFLADISTRERRAGTTGFIASAPLLQPRFVLWKFLSAMIVASSLLLVPLVRWGSPAMLVGIVLLAAAATSLGVVSGNPKTFIVIFLTFWYVSVNDRGASPALDFVGLFGSARPAVTIGYAALSIALLLLAEVVERLRRRA